MNIIIIGATSGIGRALFEKYAVDGNCIGIVGRRANLLDEQYKQHPDNTFTSTADITKQEEIEQAIHTLCTKLKHIDLAIVCSGTGDLNPSLDYALEYPAIDTNVKGWTFVIDTLYHSSTSRFMLASASRILSGLAPGLSILLIANTMGTLAACA